MKVVPFLILAAFVLVTPVDAQVCAGDKAKPITVEAKIIRYPEGLRDIWFKLEDNKTFSSLMGPGKSDRDLLRALRSAHTIDDKPLIDPRSEIEVKRSEIRFAIPENLLEWELRDMLGSILNSQLSCNGSGGVKWKGDLERKKPAP